MRFRFTFRTLLYLIAVWLFLQAGSAFASVDSFAKEWNISEVRVGFLKHDIDLPNPFSAREEDGGLDLNGEVLFYAPHFLHYIGSPRPNVGAVINTEGRTSHAYVGLQWEYAFDCGIFAGFNGGFSVHDGRIDDNKFDANHITDKRLGSRILFHAAPEVGYRFKNGYGLSLYWEHLSNGQVLTSTDTNQGLDNIGIRISYLFGK
ncbi:MAG TPA: acyloxyacyl hydrolase [Alphaproteobacteria bacterium]|nr:acyloxyacyl hydrolase [Alphaproteobacteria bacterium]